MLVCKVSYIRNDYNVRTIVLNSLCNKYAECNKDFSLPQAKSFYKNWEAFFAFCDAILDVNNIFHKNQYTIDEKNVDVTWISCGKI